jgi:hypothetical protein
VTGSRIGAVLGGLWTARMGWLLAGAVLVSWLYKVVAYKGIT